MKESLDSLREIPIAEQQSWIYSIYLAINISYPSLNIFPNPQVVINEDKVHYYTNLYSSEDISRPWWQLCISGSTKILFLAHRYVDPASLWRFQIPLLDR